MRSALLFSTFRPNFVNVFCCDSHKDPAMSDWEADDFDPSAQVADKMVALGLDCHLEENKAKNVKNGELTEKEKHEMQLNSDADIGRDLLGTQPEIKSKSLSQLRKAADYAEYAEELAEQIVAHRDHPQYLFFVNSIFNAICKPMSKLQLQSVADTVQGCLVPIIKKEEEAKKRQEKEKEEAKAKKSKKKALYEDTVADEYDDYDAKYYA